MKNVAIRHASTIMTQFLCFLSDVPAESRISISEELPTDGGNMASEPTSYLSIRETSILPCFKLCTMICVK